MTEKVLCEKIGDLQTLRYLSEAPTNFIDHPSILETYE